MKTIQTLKIRCRFQDLNSSMFRIVKMAVFEIQPKSLYPLNKISRMYNKIVW